ncbi:MICOS complex subunit MIC27 [Athalia rosae]|uniref:MICOS complex subunit MIC27 n=1 Tax=Athalia rosae TaxID=37344 RepID=UPI0020344CB2|nr:MICOS complex subunit MIC27 [Athalia rosae]
MQGIKFFKKFLMPCGLCAAVPALKPVPPPSNCPTPCEVDDKKLIRPSELPIYTVASQKADPCPTPVNHEPSYLEQGFGTVRRSLSSIFEQYQFVSDTVNNTLETGVAHSQTLYDYLREESNAAPRMGAIGIGALTGLIFGLRGGAFKKTFYTSTGALAVAAFCYPKQASEGVELVKHYANIGYNFAYGIKPGDPQQLEINFPEFSKLKIPTSFDDFIDQVKETGSAAGETIGALTSKASELLSESKQEKSTEEKPKQN